MFTGDNPDALMAALAVFAFAGALFIIRKGRKDDRQ